MSYNRQILGDYLNKIINYQTSPVTYPFSMPKFNRPIWDEYPWSDNFVESINNWESGQYPPQEFLFPIPFFRQGKVRELANQFMKDRKLIYKVFCDEPLSKEEAEKIMAALERIHTGSHTTAHTRSAAPKTVSYYADFESDWSMYNHVYTVLYLRASLTPNFDKNLIDEMKKKLSEQNQLFVTMATVSSKEEPKTDAFLKLNQSQLEFLAENNYPGAADALEKIYNSCLDEFKDTVKSVGGGAYLLLYAVLYRNSHADLPINQKVVLPIHKKVELLLTYPNVAAELLFKDVALAKQFDTQTWVRLVKKANDIKLARLLFNNQELIKELSPAQAIKIILFYYKGDLELKVLYEQQTGKNLDCFFKSVTPDPINKNLFDDILDDFQEGAEELALLANQEIVEPIMDAVGGVVDEIEDTIVGTYDNLLATLSTHGSNNDDEPKNNNKETGMSHPAWFITVPLVTNSTYYPETEVTEIQSLTSTSNQTVVYIPK